MSNITNIKLSDTVLESRCTMHEYLDTMRALRKRAISHKAYPKPSFCAIKRSFILSIPVLKHASIGLAIDQLHYKELNLRARVIIANSDLTPETLL